MGDLLSYRNLIIILGKLNITLFILYLPLVLVRPMDPFLLGPLDNLVHLVRLEVRMVLVALVFPKGYTLSKM